MAAESRLAGELVEHILLYLLHDTPSLQRCSLASRQWCAFAQPLIFRSVNIEEVTPSPSKNNDASATKPSKKVKGVVKDPTVVLGKCDIANWARDLVGVGKSVKNLEINCRTLVASEMAKILAVFRTPQRILVTADLIEDSAKHLPSLSRPLKELRLTNLKFDMNDWTPVRDPTKKRSRKRAKCALVQFLNLFGEVETLYTLDVYPVGGTGEESRDGAGYNVCRCCRPMYPEDSGHRSAIRAEGMKLSKNFSVRRVITSDTDYSKAQEGQEVVLDLLLSSPSVMNAVRELEIDEHPVMSRELLEATGAQLTRLRLSVTYPSRQGDNGPSEYGTWCCGPQLTFAHICLHHNYAMPNIIDNYWQGYNTTVQRTIRDLPETLPHLVIEFNCGKLLPDHFDWHLVDEMLVNRDLAQLELIFKIGIHELLKEDYEQFSRSTRRSIPRLGDKLGSKLIVEVMERPRGKKPNHLYGLNAALI
ncbi:hypothetical protein BXZ70DRAFT_766175 [Cristinia sonorae]|uniref:F-box domain-containing protein n=1 Tax=Cristinia sonorae TaxID=1940300 RepID=A0A8K0USF7_9AGAR|nr:hypothetical protein BXZ70DRAFT_766175 [Cristinia sonorae]